MKFLIDEDVPVKLIRMLGSLGYDAIRVISSANDRDVAHQAANEDRILITLDKDFADRFLYPPAAFNIIYIRIHPPFADNLIGAVEQLLKEVPEKNLKGLIILKRDGHMRISE